MKRILVTRTILFLLLVNCFATGYSQTVFYVNTEMVVKEGDTLYINGNLVADSDAYFDNREQVYITDSIINQGTDDALFEASSYGKMDNSLPSEEQNYLTIGCIQMVGDNTQFVLSDSIIVFSQLIIKNDSNIILKDGIQVLDSIFFQKGEVDLNGNVIGLYYQNGNNQEIRSGALINESQTSKVIDTIPIDNTSAIYQQGYIEAKKNLVNDGNESLESIGMLNHYKSGLTTYRRYHFSDTMATGGSLKKLYQLVESGNSGIDVDQTIKYLDSDNIQGTREDSLMIWQYAPASNVYDTNYTGVGNIYFPSELTDPIDTSSNEVQGIVTLEPGYIYTVAPINCDDVPATTLEDSMNVCAGSLVKLNPWEDSEIDYRDFFYNWTAPNFISQSKVNGHTSDTSVFQYSFTVDDSIVGKTFPVYVEIRDVKGCRITDSIIISVRDISLPVLQMYDPEFNSREFAICSGESFYIRDTVNSDSISTRYTWVFNSDTLYNQTRQVAWSLNTDGINDFSVKYTNEYGCVATKNAQIIVHPYPDIQVVPQETFCQGIMSLIENNTSIADLGLESAITNYSWNLLGIDSIYVGNTTPVATNGSSFQSDPVSVSNQNPDLTFLFEDSGFADVILTAESRFGCVSTDTFNLYINPSVVAQFDTSALTNTCNGSKSLFFPGDSCSTGEDISYLWTFTENQAGVETDTAYFKFNGSGTYEVELLVTSDSGCYDITHKDVVIHPQAVANFTTENQCLDASSITLFKNTSTLSDSYYWYYGNGTSDSIGSVIYDTAGTYSVSLTANNRWNCSDSTSNDIVIYPLPEVSFTTKTSSCINTQSNLFQNTSTGTETYNWNFGDGTVSYDENPEKKYNTSGLMPVTLTGTSNKGCVNSWTETILINNIIEAEFNATSASVCEGVNSEFISQSSLSGLEGITWVFGDGNSQYAPNTEPDIVYSYSESGTFEASMITHTDSGCTDTSTAVVVIASQPEISIKTEGQQCEESEIVFSLSDNSSFEDIVTYQWNFGDPSDPANNTSSSPTASHFYSDQGQYSSILSVVSDRGCKSADTLQIVIDSLPQILFGEEPIGTCASTMELIAGTGGLNYLWSDGSTSNSLLITTNGTYSVSVTDQITGCSNWKETSVELSTEVNPGLPETIQACDSVAIDAHNPGSTYLWSTGATTRYININTAGTYWVEVTDMNNCIGYDTVVATISASPDITLPDVIQSCEGTSEILDPGTVTGTYSWNTGEASQTIEVNTPGYYWVSVTDANSCTDIAITNITFNPVPIVYLGDDRNICEDNLSTISAGNPGSDYIWSSGETSQAITPSVSGIYSVDVTNTYGCTGSDTVQVQINALPVIDLGGDQSLCENDVLVLDAGMPADVYYWSTNNNTRSITVSEAGNYWVRVTDTNSCTSVSETVNISYKSLPEEPFDTYEQDACNYMLLDAGNAGSTYEWNDGNTGKNYLAEESNIYWVDITNSLGCSLRDSVNLTIKPMAVFDLGDDMEICSNGSGLIDAGYFGDDYSYSWNTGSTEQYIRVFTAGLYTLDVTHIDGCVSSDSVYVTTTEAPQIDLGEDKYLCLNSGLTLDAGVEDGTYYWGNSSGTYASTQSIAVLDTGKYWVQVFAPNGCYGTDTVEIMYTSQSIEPLFMCASNIQVGDTVRFVDLSVPEPDSYYWDFGDMVSSTVYQPEHIYYTEDTFNVQLTVTNLVCSATIKKDVTVAGYNPDYLKKLADELEGNIEGLLQITNAIVYPVPAVNYVTLSLEISKPADIALYLYNINGQIIQMEKLNGVENLEHTINISNLRNGMYFIRVVTRNESKTFKILKIE